jgi:hypothetical protein
MAAYYLTISNSAIIMKVKYIHFYTDAILKQKTKSSEEGRKNEIGHVARIGKLKKTSKQL